MISITENAARVAVVLPAYNESLTIVDTMRGFHAALPDAQIVVVNNNSSDNTEELARGCMAELRCKGGVFNERSKGKGNAVRRAFLEIDADVYLMADADLTYPPSRAKDLIAPVLAGAADMVVGDRLSGGNYARENKRSFHGFGNRLVRNLVNWLFKANLADIMSGYRAFSRRFVKNYPIMVAGFQLETDVTLHALDKRFRILEIPVEYRDRPAGSFSKLNTFGDGARVIFAIAEILRHYKPFVFFGAAAAFLAASGLLAAMPVFNDWLEYRYIYHVPLAVLAAALEISAAIAMGVGLMMDSIVHHNKLSFERELLNFRSRRPEEGQ